MTHFNCWACKKESSSGWLLSSLSSLCVAQPGQSRQARQKLSNGLEKGNWKWLWERLWEKNFPPNFQWVSSHKTQNILGTGKTYILPSSSLLTIFLSTSLRINVRVKGWGDKEGKTLWPTFKKSVIACNVRERPGEIILCKILLHYFFKQTILKMLTLK